MYQNLIKFSHINRDQQHQSLKEIETLAQSKQSKTPQERVDEWTKDSAVSSSITTANLYQIEGNQALAKLLNWNWYNHTPGWYVLSCNPVTGKRTQFGQFKPDQPLQFSPSDKPQKYFSFPKGGKTEAILLVLTLNDWIAISDRLGVPIENSDIDESRDDLGFWLWVLNHPEIPIVIAEGAKKAGCLLTFGWVGIALTGVNCGQLDKGQRLNPTLKPFIVPGRPVYLAFDADVVVKPQVEQALRTLGHLIVKEKGLVRIIRWDLEHGKGCDDLIVQHGVEAFEAAYSNALPYHTWLKSLVPESQMPKVPGKQQHIREPVASGRIGVNALLKQYEASGGNGGGGGDRGKGSNNWWDDGEENWWTKADPVEEFAQIALKLLYCRNGQRWISDGRDFYQWTGTGYLKADQFQEIRRIGDLCNAFPVAAKDGRIRFPYANANSLDKLEKWLKKRLLVNPEQLNPPGLNCTNGVLEIKWSGSIPRIELVPHDKDKHFYTYEPQVTYDPQADPHYCKVLLSCLDAPQRDIFLKTIAASLSLPAIRKFKGRTVRGLLMKGLGNNGKDTLREVVSMLYGYTGMTNCTLNDFQMYDSGRKFPLASLMHSRVNWSSENANSSQLDKLQCLKAFLTGDTITAEYKGKNGINFSPCAVAIFNVNDTPNIKGVMEAIASRWAILSFNKTYKIDADPDLGEIEADPRFKYDPEFLRTSVLPAFLNYVLDALVRLCSDGIDYKSTDKTLLEVQVENSHLFQFCLDTHLGYVKKSTLSAGEIWERLEQWYLANGTLSYEETSSGKKKPIWIEQVKRRDANIKGPNQIISRFQQLFPKTKRIFLENGRMGLSGLAFLNVPPDDSGSNDDNDGNSPVTPNTPTPTEAVEAPEAVSIRQQLIQGVDYEAVEAVDSTEDNEIDSTLIYNFEEIENFETENSQSCNIELETQLPQNLDEVKATALIEGALSDISAYAPSWPEPEVLEVVASDLLGAAEAREPQELAAATEPLPQSPTSIDVAEAKSIAPVVATKIEPKPLSPKLVGYAVRLDGVVTEIVEVKGLECILYHPNQNRLIRRFGTQCLFVLAPNGEYLKRWTRIDGSKLPLEYPGRLGRNQTKEPKTIAMRLGAIRCLADWEEILAEFGEEQALWVWRWHFNKSDRLHLAQIMKGEIEQTCLDL